MAERKPAEIFFAEEVDPSKIAERISANQVGVIDWGDPENMIFAIVGNAYSPEAIRKMNQAKGRAETQALAIAGSPTVAEQLANLDASPALRKLVAANRSDYRNVITRAFTQPVGLILPARDSIPYGVSKDIGEDRRSVMIVGQSYNFRHNYRDIYNEVIKQLAAESVACAGTSANKKDELVYTVYQQERAYADLGRDVDFFVKRANPDQRYRFRRMTSCTAFDLTGKRVVLNRWGSKDVDKFVPHLGNISVPDTVSILPGAEVPISNKVQFLFQKASRALHLRPFALSQAS